MVFIYNCFCFQPYNIQSSHYFLNLLRLVLFFSTHFSVVVLFIYSTFGFVCFSLYSIFYIPSVPTSASCLMCVHVKHHHGSESKLCKNQRLFLTHPFPILLAFLISAPFPTSHGSPISVLPGFSFLRFFCTNKQLNMYFLFNYFTEL